MRSLSPSGYRVIIVDDGSEDSTSKIVKEKAQRIPLLLEQHKMNMGLGATIRRGIDLAAKSSFDDDIVVVLDADDTQTPSLIIRMVKMIQNGYDVVIASRYRSNSKTTGVPFYRRVLSYSASWIFRLLLPINGVRDYTCGYRAYRASIIKLAIKKYGDNFINRDGFEVMVDILLKLGDMKIIIGEVPLVLRYDRKENPSSMNVMQTIKSSLLLLAQRVNLKGKVPV